VPIWLKGELDVSRGFDPGYGVLGPGSPPFPRFRRRSLSHLAAALRTNQAVVTLAAIAEALVCTKRTGNVTRALGTERVAVCDCTPAVAATAGPLLSWTDAG
jgi:hypothetical protein